VGPAISLRTSVLALAAERALQRAVAFARATRHPDLPYFLDLRRERRLFADRSRRGLGGDDPRPRFYSPGLLRGHEKVPVGVLLDLLHALARVVHEDAVELLAHPQDLLGLDVDVGGLALHAAQRLVDHDARVRQARKRLPLAPAHSSSAPIEAALPMQIVEMAGFTYCNRVVDGHAGGDGAAGRVDVEVDVLVGVLRLEEEHLRDDEVGELVLDERRQEDDPFLEQTREDVEGALAAGVCSITSEPGPSPLSFISANISVNRCVGRSGNRASALAEPHPSASRVAALLHHTPHGRRRRWLARAIFSTSASTSSSPAAAPPCRRWPPGGARAARPARRPAAARPPAWARPTARRRDPPPGVASARARARPDARSAADHRVGHGEARALEHGAHDLVLQLAPLLGLTPRLELPANLDPERLELLELPERFASSRRARAGSSP